MRKLILGLAISLDGFIEGPNGEYDWCFTDQDYGMSGFFKRIDSLFIGRKTYEMTLQMGDQSAAGFPKLKEYVFSKTLDKVKKGSVLISKDVKRKVQSIKKEKGKDIWLFGGAGLTSSLMKLKLVDELFLAVHPVLLGKGKPLFNDLEERINLTLLNSKKYTTGLVSLTYSLG